MKNYECQSIHRILSKPIGENNLRYYIDVKGCNSYSNFILHLERNISQDFDKIKLSKKNHFCEECKKRIIE